MVNKLPLRIGLKNQVDRRDCEAGGGGNHIKETDSIKQAF
jgi:hypothetical protein